MGSDEDNLGSSSRGFLLVTVHLQSFRWKVSIGSGSLIHLFLHMLDRTSDGYSDFGGRSVDLKSSLVVLGLLDSLPIKL